jgi:hypothetical protein
MRKVDKLVVMAESKKPNIFGFQHRFGGNKQIRHSGDGRNCSNSGKLASVSKFAKKTKTDGIVAVKRR